MRVAQVNDIAFVGSTLARALRDLGVAADLIEPWRPGASIPYPWKLVTLPFRAAGLLAAAMRVRSGHYDIAHVHYARLGIVGPLGGRPYVLHCHGTDIRGIAPGSTWGREVAPFLRRAALVYYATPDLGPWVEAFRHDARFLPNPIEIAEPIPPSAEPPRDILVGVRLDPVKGPEAIAATLGEVVRRRPATSVTIVDHGAEVERVRAAVGAAAQVIPPVAHAAMPDLLRRHRLVIGQQRIGALGNHELEALAAGVPVASAFRYPTAYDSPPPLIDGETVGARAERIVVLLDDEPARLELAAAGRRWIETHHGAAAIAARVADDYRRIIGAS